MTESLVRLAWALPLVLVCGVGAALLLRRGMLLRAGTVAGAAAPMSLVQTVPLSEQTRAHLLAIGAKSVLVVESPTGTVVHSLTDPVPTPGGAGWWRGGRP